MDLSYGSAVEDNKEEVFLVKQKRTLTIAFLAFAGLLALYAGIRFYTQKRSNQKAASSKIIIKKLNSITSISYYNGSNLSFTKKNGKWYYTKNKDYPLIQSSINSIVSPFQNMEAVRKLGKGDSLSDYGLDHPSYTIHVKDKGGNRTTFYIGNETGDNYYLTIDDKSTIYTISSNSISSLSSSLSDLIKTDSFPALSTGNLKKVVITKNGKATIYSSTSKKNSLDGIAGGLGVFTFGDCQNYAVKNSELSKYGLDTKKRISVDITYKDTTTKKKKSLTLYIGSMDQKKKNYYVKLKNSRMVYLTDAEVVKNVLNP